MLTCAEPCSDFSWASPDVDASDPRVHDISCMLEFVTDFGLDGIVAWTDTLIAHPELFAQAKERGLKILSYGTRSNEEEFIVWQLEQGISGIIYDNLVN